MVEVGGLLGKIGFDNIEPSVAIIIAHGYAHAALRNAILVEGTAHLGGDFGEGPVMIVMVQTARHRIAGDVNIRPSVIIKIRSASRETIRTHRNPLRSDIGRRKQAVRIGDARSLRDVLKRPVAAIVVEDVRATSQPLWPAGDRDTEIATVSAVTGWRGNPGIEVHIVGHKQIEVAIAVIVDETAPV